MKIFIRSLLKLFFGAGFLIILLAGNSFGQDCPVFRIKEVKNVVDDGNNGKVVVRINASKLYNQDNFQIRQKQNQVTGSIGYNVDIKVTRNQLEISGLKKSVDMYLDEYVILFSDKSCNNSEIVEVVTFKIK
jgi:hypothetical protein